MSEFTVTDEDGQSLKVQALYPRAKIRKQFKVSDRQLYNYVLLLLEAVPDEFEYQKHTECFDEEQYKALVKVRQFFKAGLHRKQILNKLRIEGI